MQGGAHLEAEVLELEVAVVADLAVQALGILLREAGGRRGGRGTSADVGRVIGWSRPCRNRALTFITIS